MILVANKAVCDGVRTGVVVAMASTTAGAGGEQYTAASSRGKRKVASSREFSWLVKLAQSEQIARSVDA